MRFVSFDILVIKETLVSGLRWLWHDERSYKL